jgi:hypothetical protein
VSTDLFAHDDAAYVLGTLGPVERRAFEEHLSGCAACTRAVAELAGLPPLLAQLDESAFADSEDSPPVPDTLLPRLLTEVRKSRRRGRLVAMVGAAAAAVLVAVLAGVLLVGGGSGSDPQPIPTPAQAMTPVHQGQLSATVELQQVAWGTRMQLSCTYVADEWGEGAAPSYALVVRTRDGQTQQIATWRAVPGQETHLEAATAADPDDIASVDVVLAGTRQRVLTLANTTDS